MPLARRLRLEARIAAQAAVTLPHAADKLDIAELRLFPVREPVSGRTFSVLRVRTQSGLTGYGECAEGSAGELAAAADSWKGRAATSYARNQPDSPLAGAIDIALLDILGRTANAPVFRILGGPTRNKVRVYTSVSDPAGAEPVTAIRTAAAAGHRAFGVRLPAPAARNQGEAYQREVIRLAEAVRALGGDFVAEGAWLLTPGDAARVAAALEHLHPLWFDEPCAVGNHETIRKVAAESTVPLGFGRGIRTPGVFQDLLRESWIDVVRPDLAHFGITGVRRIAALAETYYVAVAPHHSGGPVATAAALHLAASLPNFFIQHVPMPFAEQDRRMRAELAGGVENVKDGFANLPTGPGLGIAVNEAALEKYRAS